MHLLGWSCSSVCSVLCCMAILKLKETVGFWNSVQFWQESSRRTVNELIQSLRDLGLWNRVRSCFDSANVHCPDVQTLSHLYLKVRPYRLFHSVKAQASIHFYPRQSKSHLSWLCILYRIIIPGPKLAKARSTTSTPDWYHLRILHLRILRFIRL